MDSFTISVWRPEASEREVSTSSNNGMQNNIRARGVSRGRGNLRGGRFDRRLLRPGERCETITVPSKFVGKIIGRSGTNIMEMESRSGAKIYVDRESQGAQTIVTLRGRVDSINIAKSLIEDIIGKLLSMALAQNGPQATLHTQDVPPDEGARCMTTWEQKKMQESDEAAWATYPPVKTQFYKEHPAVMEMSEADVEKFRKENNNIMVERSFKTEKCAPIPKPCPGFMHAFYEYPEILDEIGKAGLSKPTPIQAQAWPIVLSGEDLIALSPTGTGKTLAFLLPALIHIDGQDSRREDRDGPAVLIMTPTRELAIQIDDEVKRYKYRGITSMCLFGGGDRTEVKILTRGVDLVIGTPERINDLLVTGYLNVKTVTYVVLDEADRMLDMGFEPQIHKVMYCIRPNRQTIITSGTWTIGVKRLSESYMKDPVQINIGSLDSRASHTVTQIIQLMPDDNDVKMEAVMEFARNLGKDKKAIIFCATKGQTENLTTELAYVGVHCEYLHDSRDRREREQALIDFGNGRVRILVATGDASRCLDVDDVTHILNYDFPRSIEEYVHRVGLTGRADQLGESISYFTRNDGKISADLIKILEEANQFVPEDLCKIAQRLNASKENSQEEYAINSGAPPFGLPSGMRHW